MDQFLTIYFVLVGTAYLVKSFVIVLGELWRDLVVYTILPQTLLPSSLPPNTDQSSLC